MADGRVVIDVILDDGSVAKGVANIEKELGGIQGTASKVVSGLARVGAAVGAAIGAAGLAVGKIGLEFNAMKEQSMVAWTTLLGSAKEAGDMLQRISDLAKKTPFETADVDMMAKYMHNAGLAGDNLFKQLMRISDVSSAFAIPAAEAREMARQMSQVMQAGVAYTEDLNILQDRGVPIYKAISEQLGVTVADVRKLASEGKITSDIYIAAFNNIAKGVAGASQAQSQTFNGMISTFKDNIKILAGELTEGLFNRVKGGLSNVLGLLEDFTAGLQQGGLKGAFEAILPPSVFQRLQAFGTGFMNVFNTIKSFVVPALTAVGAFILAKINELKAFWDQNGAQIMQAVKNVFNGIKAVIEFVMPVVLFIVKSVWENIKGVINGALKVIKGLIQVFAGLFTGDFRKMWEGIKNIFSGAIQFVWNLFNLLLYGRLLKAGKALFTSLKNIFINGWNFIKSKSSAFFNWIKSFASSSFSGMWKAISGLMNKVVSTIHGAWNKAVGFIKGINLKEIGKDVIRGLIKGISSMAGAAIDAVQDIGKKITGGIKKILGIASPSKVMRDQVGKNIGAGVAEGIKRSTKSAVSAARAQARAVSEAIKNLEVKFDTGKISATKYISELKKIQSRYKLTGDQTRKIQKEIYAANQSIQKNVTSLNSGIKGATEKYFKSVKSINDNLNKNIQNLKNEYNKQLSELTQSIYGQIGLFDEVKSKRVDPAKILQNLRDQNALMKQFQNDLARLQKMGVSKDFIKELREMGLDAADEIHAIASMPKNMLNEYVAAWREKHNLAKQEATAQLADAKKQMEAQIKSLTEAAKKQLANAKSQWISQLKSFASLVKKLGDYKNSGKVLGKNTVAGIINGLKSMTGPLASAAKSIANTLIKEIKKTLKIKSPSRVMRDEVGKMIGLGLAKGIDQSGNVALRSMSNLTNSLIRNPLRGVSLPINLTPATVMAGSGGGYVQGRISAGMLSTERFYSLVSAIREVAKRPVSVQVNGREFIYATVDDFDEVLKFKQSRIERFRRGGS